MGSRGAVIAVITLLALSIMPMVVSADSDGDGISDATDDCIWSSGTSTVDRTGCPDFDNDGTSDINDRGLLPILGLRLNKYCSNQNYNDIEYSGDGYS